MSLRECIDKHTHREYLAALDWIDRQWNIPDKKDYGLMVIAREVKRVLAKDPNQIQVDEFKLKFVKEKKRKMTREQASKVARSVWQARLTPPPSREELQQKRVPLQGSPQPFAHPQPNKFPKRIGT